MRESRFASMRLAVGFYCLASAFGMSLPAQAVMAARTDAQAQARTVWDIDRVGRAMFSWLIDQVSLSAKRPQARDAVAAATVEMNHYPVISHADLQSLLVPTYILEVPELDGWNHPYDFRLNLTNLLANEVMAIRSLGRDGTSSGTLYTVGTFDPASFDEDIVWANGSAAHWPAIVLSGRERQKKTVADIRNIGHAMLSWLTDQVSIAPPATPLDLRTVTVHFPNYPVITHGDLVNLLVPLYIHEVPEVDGWDHPYDFRLNLANLLGNEVMAIRSPGGDGTFSTDTYLTASFDPNLFDEDVVWADGFFVRSPGPLLGLAFFSLSPCRVFDTRLSSALQSGAGGLFEIGTICDIPTSAKAVAVNGTVVEPTGAGFVTLFPAGLQVPASSTINFAAGQTRGNNAILGLTEDGIGSIEALPFVEGSGQVHLILDVVGYFE